MPVKIVAACLFWCCAHAAAEELSLYVTVEKDGNLVQGLTASNFRLYEEGEARPFRLEQADKPASIVLLVEHSENSWYYQNDFRSAIRGFLGASVEGHWYALALFAHEVTIPVDFTRRRGKILEGYSSSNRPFWDEIDTYDAVSQMLAKFSRLEGRRILIFVGTGFDTFSSHTLDDVQKLLESTNVVVYAAGAGSALRGAYEPYLSVSGRMDMLRARAFLSMLADKSGGQAWFPRFETAFPDVMEGIMQTVETQYLLKYVTTLPKDGKFHPIEVQAFVVKDDKREDFKVRVREGWRR